MTDMFKDTWTYQTMQQMAQEEAEQKVRKEMQEVRKEAQQRWEQTTLALVSERFPKLVRLTKKQIKFTRSTDQLQHLLLHLSLARDETEAENYLLHFDEEDTSVPVQEEVG